MYMPDEPHRINYAEGELEETENDKSERIEATVAALRKNRRIAVPASSNGTQRQRIMEVLARVQPFFGTSIEEVLQTERTHLPSGATVVVITTTISERLVDILARIRQGGHAVSILFVGDSPLPIRIAGVTVYHIGGEETWNSFVAGYSTRTEQNAANLPALHM